MNLNLLILCVVATLAACAPTATTAPPAMVAPPPPGLGALIGKPAPAVITLLGPASLDRSEGPARLLQFVRPLCVFDVFLYPPTPGAVALVRTAAARRPDGSRIDPGACLALILPARP